MRIISGKFRSRRIEFPPLKNAEALTRPTTDMARESLFNMLQNWLPIDEEGSTQRVLDLFAGTGAVGLEFLSRGAAWVDFVDASAVCIQSIRRHAQLFEVEQQCGFFRSDALAFLRTQAAAALRYDYIFIDPPYAMPRLSDLPALVLSLNLLREGTGILILEHDDRYSFSSDSLPQFVETRHYGKSCFSFFTV